MKKLLSALLSVLLLSSLTGCLSNNYENGELYIYLPGEYLSDEVVEQFEYEYGVKVYVTTFDSNESMYTKLLGGTVYDLLIPSDYMIERLISEKMIQKLDKSKIPNMSAIDEAVLNMEFDPNNDYSVPYFWGNAGICYDTTQIDAEDVESEGWEVMRNTKYRGMIYMYDSIRDAFMMAEKALGYSMIRMRSRRAMNGSCRSPRRWIRLMSLMRSSTVSPMAKKRWASSIPVMLL